jgi:hypothetical protein
VDGGLTSSPSSNLLAAGATVYLLGRGFWNWFSDDFAKQPETRFLYGAYQQARYSLGYETTTIEEPRVALPADPPDWFIEYLSLNDMMPGSQRDELRHARSERDLREMRESLDEMRRKIDEAKAQLSLDGSLNRIDRLLHDSVHIFYKDMTDLGPRTEPLLAYVDLAVEHNSAIILLTRKKLFGSALALVRPVIEISWRGTWTAACGTDEQVM